MGNLWCTSIVSRQIPSYHHFLHDLEARRVPVVWTTWVSFLTLRVKKKASVRPHCRVYRNIEKEFCFISHCCYGSTAEFFFTNTWLILSFFFFNFLIYSFWHVLFFFRRPRSPFVRETEPELEPEPEPERVPVPEEQEDTGDLRNKVQKLEEEVQQVRCYWEMSSDARLPQVTHILAWELALDSAEIRVILFVPDPWQLLLAVEKTHVL